MVGRLVLFVGLCVVSVPVRAAEFHVDPAKGGPAGAAIPAESGGRARTLDRALCGSIL